eukprot:40727-Amphidinium_carterae.1
MPVSLFASWLMWLVYHRRFTDTGIFRVVEPSASLSRQDLLGQSAIDFINELERDLRVHPHADRILEETLSDVHLGLAGQLDSTFGKGGWRPIPRHIIAHGVQMSTHRRWPPLSDQ